MRLSLCLLFIALIVSTDCFSQEKRWQVGLFSFFDNTEFGQSAVKIPQTMSGVHFLPEVGLSWESTHSVNVGFDLLYEFGSSEVIDFFYPTAYYSYDRKPFRFLMGAFPRKTTIDNYPRLFFQDSISYYRPNINGVFWEFRKDKDYINLWLDWTGRMSTTTRETFFMGLSGRYNPGILYFQHFAYMYHFAGYSDPTVDEPYHDNGLLLTSLGIDLSGKTALTRLDVNAGWAVGLDRSRADQTGWVVHNGILIETTIEYKFIGIFNSFYNGDGQMDFYNDHGNDLYWGDPVYRAGAYNRADLYVNFIKNKIVSTRFTYSLHFMESKVYHEQMLKVSFNINNY